MTKFDIVIYCLRICGLECVFLRNLVIGLIQGKAYVQFNFRLITLFQYSGFSTRFYTIRDVQPQKMARSLILSDSVRRGIVIFI